MCKVTVLVAAYNAEKYIEQCIDSLKAQTLDDWQAVCVDDASTDSTLQILDKLASDDERITVMHLEENTGQANARNVGLRMAEGKYVCMLDSDDWMSEDALQTAVEVFEDNPETDCVLFQLREVYDDHERRYPMPEFTVMSGEEAFERSLTWEIHGLYMVRTHIHLKYPYDDSSKAYSDDNTTRIHYLFSKEVRQCQGVYYYRQHRESVTHKASVRRIDFLRANESMRRQMVDAQVDNRLLNLYEKERWLNLIGTYMFYFFNRKSLSTQDRKYALHEMHRVWLTVDTKVVPLKLKMKPGYMPLRPFWSLFRAQEELYFWLRKTIKGK